jgi:hypothetical protein
MRRWLITTFVIVALLVVADRVAVHAADSLVAKRIQQEQGLSSRPDVSIGGFPFLTQAISGRYDEVTVTLHDVRRGPVPVQTLSAKLVGVHVPLSAVFSRSLHDVPVDRASATVLISYAAIDTYLGPRHIRASHGPGTEVHLTGSATVAGRTVSAAGNARLSVDGDDVVMTGVPGLDVTIPLTGLPFQIRLLSAKATSAGVVVAASAQGLVLPTGSAVRGSGG